MGKRRTYHLLLCITSVLLLIGCKKPEVNTNRLSNQGNWEVTQLLIDDNSHSPLPRWYFDKSTDYKAFASGKWVHSDGSTAQYIWKFDPHKGTFHFKLDHNVIVEGTNKAYMQCQNLSGEYIAVTDKRKLFEFESISTYGYGELPVFIRIEPY